MKFSPLFDRLVVERLEAESKSRGGIVLPDNAKEKPQIGVVLAAGPGGVMQSGETLAMSVKVGQKVLFTTYAGNEVEHEGKKYVFLRELDVLAVVN